MEVGVKLAVLSDIHSNIFALEAIIEDMKSYAVDIKINLGDIFYGPIAPRQTYELLQKDNFITICGNQDRQLLEAKDDEIAQNPTLQYVLNNLGIEPLAWMRELPTTALFEDEVFLCHGTPYDDMVYLLEETQSGFPLTRSEEKILALLQGIKAPLILCGHSHLPKIIFLAQTRQTIVNAGSVGLQAYRDIEPYMHCMQNGSPDASYALVEKTSSGWSVEHKRVAYDFEKASSLAFQNGRNDWEYALKTGKVEGL